LSWIKPFQHQCLTICRKHIGDSDWAWRAPSILQAAYPIIQLCFFWFVPESPRWLIANGKIAKAREILARYHTGGDSSHMLIEFEMAEISAAIEAEQAAAETKWSSLVSTPGNRKRTCKCPPFQKASQALMTVVIVVCVGAFAQWNGVAIISYYLTLVLDTVGIKDADTQTLING
jgi:hypothetical protein